MGLFSFLSKTKTISKADKLAKLAVGDTVYIRFIDPKQMGYSNVDDAFSRFDVDDLKTNSAIGQITKVKQDPVMDLFIIEMTSVKPSGRIRNQMFLETEIIELEFFKKESI
jgi:hypothetical protein